MPKAAEDLRLKHLSRAARASNLYEFGTLDFVEPLDVLLHDLEREAHLTYTGKVLARRFIQRLLRLRLKVISREVPDVAIHRPIVVLGLPRTGSTLLHEWMATHPQLRAPTFWESHSLPTGSSWDHGSRAVTHLQLAALNVISHNLKHIHALHASGPHECVSLQAPSFRSMEFHAAFRLPNYNRWMMANFDWGPAYDWHKTMLAHLETTDRLGAARRWVLKAPAHMLSLDSLLKTYPDALFIQTHRNPLEVIPSMASLTLTLRRICSRTHDVEEIGEDVLQLWNQGISRVMEARALDPELNKRFIDIHVNDLNEAMESTLIRIAQHLDIEPNEWVPRLLRQRANGSKTGHKAHAYSLTQFGLDETRIQRTFTDYAEHYLHQP